MRSLRLLSIAALLLAAAPTLFAADFGVRAGRSNELDEEFVGVELVMGNGAFKFNPNVEYYLIDGVNAATANADVLYEFGSSSVRPYVGGGVGLFWIDSDFGDDTETLVNAIGGVQFNLDFLRPYGQVKYSRSVEDEGGDDVSLVIGLRF